MKVLHILPDTAGDPRQKYLGSTKDLRGRSEYFRARGMEVEELVVPKRKDRVLSAILKAKDLSSFHAVFIELPIYPGTISWLRKRHPSMKVLVRSINAEFFHQWHYVASGLKHGYYKRALRYALFSWHRLYQDWACARAAHRLLSISAWETEHYWLKVAGPEKAFTVPYFIPESYAKSAHAVEKEDICVCLQSTIMNSFLADSARNFHTGLEDLGEALPEWKFLVTGGNPPAPRKPLSRLQATGLLDSPFDLLARARAMALLSDYGLGFKTKILEAILLRCFVLVTPGLFARLPEELLPFCQAVDPSVPGSFRAALEACLRPFPDFDPNALLRDKAYAAMDRAFSE